MVPADGNFTTAIQKGDHKAGQVQGQTRQHARLINLLGVKQLVVCVNKMDAPETAEYKEARFKEIADEMKSTLIKVGWPKPFVMNRTPVIPISGWHGDNLLEKSTNMDWWKGQNVKISKEKSMLVTTLKEALNDFVQPAKRDPEKAMRLPISGVYEIKGVGDVLTGRVEQGEVKPGEEVMFLPTHTQVNPCTGKVFTVEMHHKRVEAGMSGDNVGMNVKNLKKENMPRVGDVMVYAKDTTLAASSNFTAQVQVLDIPGSIKNGYSPIGHVRCGRAACRMVLSSLWLSTPSRTVMVCPVLLSWMATLLSCLARWSLSTPQSPGPRARPSKCKCLRSTTLWFPHSEAFVARAQQQLHL